MNIADTIKKIDPSFQEIVNPKFDPQGEAQTGRVWGRVIKAGITLRVVVIDKSIHICFVKRAIAGDGVTQIRSTRWTDAANLEKCLFDWREQFEKENIVCNKCVSGWYEIRRGGKDLEVKCNRCRAKGWQDYDDQLANEKYDYVMKKQVGRDGHDFKPHWKPY